MAFDHLVQALDPPFASLPDGRTGKPTRYASKDAARGALAVFVTQSPSLLASQRTMRQAPGRSHANRLFGLGEMPCDHPLRTRRDPIDPAQLLPGFEGGDEALERSAQLGAFRAFAGPWRIAFDGTA